MYYLNYVSVKLDFLGGLFVCLFVCHMEFPGLGNSKAVIFFKAIVMSRKQTKKTSSALAIRSELQPPGRRPGD